MNPAMLGSVLRTVLQFSVATNGAEKLDILKSKVTDLRKLTERGMFAKSAKKLLFGGSFDFVKLARLINTLAANIRFFQITVMMFIGGRVVRGLWELFFKMNMEMESARLSLEAIIQSQVEMNIKKKQGLDLSTELTKTYQKQANALAQQKSLILTMASTKLAIKTGADIGEMIKSARGIQINTGDIQQTVRLLETASTLALLDPQQGMAGATYAIRELMQGQGARDFRSLANRFEINFSLEFKQKFMKSVQSGKIKEAIDAFQEELACKGITEKILKKLESSLMLSLSVIKGSFRLAFAEMGRESFNTFKDYFSKYSKDLFKFDLLDSNEFRVLRSNVGPYLDNSFVKPFINTIETVREYIFTFFDPQRLNFIFAIADKIKVVFSTVATASMTLLNSFFKGFGTKSGDNVADNIINFINDIVNKLLFVVKNIVGNKNLMNELGHFVSLLGILFKMQVDERALRFAITFIELLTMLATVFMYVQLTIGGLILFLKTSIDYIAGFIVDVVREVSSVIKSIMFWVGASEEEKRSSRELERLYKAGKLSKEQQKKIDDMTWVPFGDSLLDNLGQNVKRYYELRNRPKDPYDRLGEFNPYQDPAIRKKEFITKTKSEKEFDKFIIELERSRQAQEQNSIATNNLTNTNKELNNRLKNNQNITPGMAHDLTFSE